jgi:hypothetical protein
MAAAQPTRRNARERRLLADTGALLIAAALTVASFATVPSSAVGAAKRNCGGVSYSFHSPAGGIAFNQVVAENVSCATARSVALDFLKPKAKPPAGWHERYKDVTVGGSSQSDEFFTKGDQTVIGEDEAG